MTSGKTKSPVDVPMWGVRDARRVRSVARVTRWIAVEGTHRSAKRCFETMVVLKVGHTGRPRRKTGQIGGGRKDRKSQTFLGHRSNNGTVIHKRQMLLGIDVRIQWLAFTSRSLTCCLSPRSARKGIVVTDTRMTQSTVIGMIGWAGQWKTCLQQQKLIVDSFFDKW